MVITHLTASPFFGGPERQMLGLARSLPADYRSFFLAFAERGLGQPFTRELERHGFACVQLVENMPRLLRAAHEVAGHLVRIGADVLCCHGYKCDVVGWAAARLANVPIVSVSRGWTAATRRVRAYESLDRLCLRAMDRVVCVSDGQATKVLRAGVAPDRVTVIRNAIEPARFHSPDPSLRDQMRQWFAAPPARIVCAAGRLSPEKGFADLVEAASRVLKTDPSVGFVLFGDGPLRPALERQIDNAGLAGRFLLPGFRSDVDRFIPHADLVVLPSLTEGLPNVALEASAAGVAVVATAVGGTPEVVRDGVNGYLVPPGDPPALARRIVDALASDPTRAAMGRRGRDLMRDEFTFAAQARGYARLFDALATGGGRIAGDPNRQSAHEPPAGVLAVPTTR